MAYDPLSSIGPTSATASLSPVPKTNPLDDSDERLKAFDAKQEGLSKQLESVRSDTVARNEKLEDYFSQNKAPVYKPPEPYKPPQQDNPISLWGALAIGFAGLASHFTRTPMTTALNASAAAMKSMKEGNVEAAKASYEQWKDANAQALEMAKYQQEAYKNLMATVERREKNNIDLGKEQMADVRAQMTALASAFRDDTMLKIGQERDVVAQKAEFDRRQKEIDQVDEAGKKLQLGWDKAYGQIEGAQAEAALKTDPEYQKMVASGDTIGAMQKIAEANPGNTKNNVALQTAQEKKRVDDEKQQQYEDSAKGQAAQQFKDWKASPEGQTASFEDRLKKENEIYQSFKGPTGARMLPPLTPENQGFQAREMGEYRLRAPSQELMAHQPGWDKAFAQTEKEYPGFNPANFDLVQAARKKLEVGKDSDAIASYTRLNQHLEFFKGLIDRLPDTEDINVLNKIAAAWGRETGNPSVTSFETARELVGDEIVKAVTGTGAAGALGDRENIKKNFEPSLGHQQLMANVNAVKALVGGAIVSTRDKYQNMNFPKAELDAVFPSPEVLEDFHIDPVTGKVKIEGIYDFGGVKTKVGPDGVTPVTTSVPGAPAAGGFAAKWVDKNGKPFGLVGGKYVYADGTPVQ